MKKTLIAILTTFLAISMFMPNVIVRAEEGQKIFDNIDRTGLNNVFVNGGIFGNQELHWYEKGVKQGVYGQKGNVWYDGTERGREIYDPLSNAWYWLDCIYDGARADSKEVFMPYVYSDEKNWINDDNKVRALANESNAYTEDAHGRTAQMADQVYKAIKNGTGKWVRYNSEGKMIKGWYYVFPSYLSDGVTIDRSVNNGQGGNIYYYDYKTGLMAKGTTIIDNKEYFFDEITGALQYVVENGNKVTDVDFELLKNPHTHNWEHHDAVYVKIDPNELLNGQYRVQSKPAKTVEEKFQNPIAKCILGDDNRYCAISDDVYVITGYETKTRYVATEVEVYWNTPASLDVPVIVAEAYDICTVCGGVK